MFKLFNFVYLFFSWIKSPPLLSISVRKEYSRTPEPIDSHYNYHSRSIIKQTSR